VTARVFGGYHIPVPIQSLVLRDYCQRKGMLYVLPVNENIFPSSYLVLEGLVRDLSAYEGVVMCSMYMLPLRRERRRRICRSVLDQGGTLHFVIEGQAVRTDEDLARLEELLTFGEMARQARIVALEGLPQGAEGE
jgi:sporadic carbohydrate cluster protein (TIGR04323 family)